jgi:hypothetical protein
VWIVTGTHPGYTLELPDQKARGLLVQIVLKRLSPEHAHKVFGEMPDGNCSSIRFLSLISHVVLLTPFRVFAVAPNPVPRADCFAIVMRSWPS